jgi:hypothetical protein
MTEACLPGCRQAHLLESLRRAARSHRRLLRRLRNLLRRVLLVAVVHGDDVIIQLVVIFILIALIAVGRLLCGSSSLGRLLILSAFPLGGGSSSSFLR